MINKLINFGKIDLEVSYGEGIGHFTLYPVPCMSLTVQCFTWTVMGHVNVA